MSTVDLNLKSMVFGGEGLFLATLQGHGTVWLQSMPFARLAQRITGMYASGKGEGSVLGARCSAGWGTCSASESVSKAAVRQGISRKGDFPRAIPAGPPFPVGAMSIDEKLQKLAEDFAVFPGKDERNAYLFDLGKRLKVGEPSIRTSGNEIKGCQFKSWLSASFEDGAIKFTADSEALLGKGMMHVCLELLDGERPEAILKFDPTAILPRLGLDQHMSSTRSNAFVLVPQQMKQRALEFSTV